MTTRRILLLVCLACVAVGEFLLRVARKKLEAALDPPDPTPPPTPKD